MKRFLSALLVAMLIVTCLSTVAFAATVVNPGDTQTFTVTVSGDEFTNYGLQLSADAGVTITNITGVTANVGTGKVGYAGSENITSHSFQVTVQITATAPGIYNVYASVLQADKKVTVEDENGNPVVKLVPVTLSANGASFEIVCDHEWGDWEIVQEPTCTEPGSKMRVCSKCGEEDIVLLPAAHTWETEWTHNAGKHWHECSVCGMIADEADHEWIHMATVDPTPEQDGYNYYRCNVCGRDRYDTLSWTEPPKVGDIRPMMALGISAVLGVLAAVAYVFKRKNII